MLLENQLMSQLNHVALREIFQTQKLVKVSKINWIPTDERKDLNDCNMTKKTQKDLRIRITTCSEPKTANSHLEGLSDRDWSGLKTKACEA